MPVRTARIRKIIRSNNVLIERALPSEGHLDVQVGSKVEPFNKLGMSKVSYGFMNVGEGLKIHKGKVVGGYFYVGDRIGNINGNDITAPFDGYLLEKEGGGYVFKQEDRDYWLLSGVWGEITGLVENRAVLIKTQTMDFHLAASTEGDLAGELIVFPNPTQLLDMQYLEKFAKDIFGKIIYIGDFARSEVVQRAAEMGASGILAGGTDRESFRIAKNTGLFLGVFGGFGSIPTPEFIFDELKDISNRYVFLKGKQEVMRIPVPETFSGPEIRKNGNDDPFKLVRSGDKVQIFVRPHFGWFGEVRGVSGDKLKVMIEEISDIVEVEPPNVIAVE